MGHRLPLSTLAVLLGGLALGPSCGERALNRPSRGTYSTILEAYDDSRHVISGTAESISPDGLGYRHDRRVATIAVIDQFKGPPVGTSIKIGIPPTRTERGGPFVRVVKGGCYLLFLVNDGDSYRLIEDSPNSANPLYGCDATWSISGDLATALIRYSGDISAGHPVNRSPCEYRLPPNIELALQLAGYQAVVAALTLLQSHSDERRKACYCVAAAESEMPGMELCLNSHLGSLEADIGAAHLEEIRESAVKSAARFKREFIESPVSVANQWNVRRRAVRHRGAAAVKAAEIEFWLFLSKHPDREIRAVAEEQYRVGSGR